MAATYVANRIYQVQIAKPVTVAGHLFLPRHQHEMTGEFLNRLIAENSADVVASAIE